VARRFGPRIHWSLHKRDTIADSDSHRNRAVAAILLPDQVEAPDAENSTIAAQSIIIIFRIFAAFAVSEPVRDRDFLALKSALAAAPARSELARLHGGYAWRIEHPRPSVSDLLIAVLWSAADLMLDARKRRVRQCANEKCLWLFIDESKSGTRRWCDMASCGNRAKARRHYLKTKS